MVSFVSKMSKYSDLLTVFGKVNPFTSNEKHFLIEDSSKPWLSDVQKKIIFSIFRRTVFEACWVGTIASLTLSCAASSTMVRPLLLQGISTVLVNFLFKSVCGYQDYRINKDRISPSICSAFITAVFYEATLGVLLHEFGHVAAIKLLCSHSHIEIRWVSFFKGITTYSNNGLSLIGKALGKEASTAFIYAAGPLFVVAASVSALVIGLKLRKSHPELSLYLRMTSLVTIAHHVLYAYSALRVSQDCSTHDFVRLWNFGLHPHVAAISMVALLGMSAIAYLAAEKRASVARTF